MPSTVGHLPEATSLWRSPELDHLGAAILCTVAYADVFDYPLTAVQIHRYLVGKATTLDTVRRALHADRGAGAKLEQRDGYYVLPGRASLVDLRQRRTHVSTRMWPQAVRYAEAISRLPFVRLVALTGALTMDNVDADDDFDFLIVTEPGRLWLTRAIVIGLVVKPASHWGNEVCPNYLLSERALAFQDRNLYVAHELSQMVPLAGVDLYRQIRDANAWTRRFLPNAAGPPRAIGALTDRRPSIRSLSESLLRTPIGAGVEQWERKRKIRRFQTLAGATASFDEDHCKGHFRSNEQRVLQAFAERLRCLERA